MDAFGVSHMLDQKRPLACSQHKADLGQAAFADARQAALMEAGAVQAAWEEIQAEEIQAAASR